MKKNLVLALLSIVLFSFLFSSCKSTVAQTLDKDFPKSEYLTFLGSGFTLNVAEQNAIENLATYFGFDTVFTSFQNVEGLSGLNYDAKLSNEEAIATITGIRGVTIERSYVENGVYYALAVMNRARTIETYSALLSEKIDSINESYDVLSKKESYDLNDLALCSLLYNETTSYFDDLKILSKFSTDQARHFSEAVHSQEDVDNLIKKVHQSIPFYIEIEGRGRGRTELQDALTEFLVSRNFKTGEESSPYGILIEYELVPVVMKDSNRFFYKYSLMLSIVNLSDETVIMNLEASAREGHESADLARDRCIEKMVAIVSNDLANAFDSQFSSL